MNKIKVGAHAQYLVQECVHVFVCVCVCVCVCCGGYGVAY